MSVILFCKEVAGLSKFFCFPQFISIINLIQELQATLRAVREKNSHLEKSLSAENRLKQELFRALSEARAQMADFQR